MVGSALGVSLLALPSVWCYAYSKQGNQTHPLAQPRQMKTETYVLPSFYASALINGDYTGLTDHEEQSLDEWVFHNTYGKCCIDIGEDKGFLKYHDMMNVGVLASDCAEFTFS